MDASLTVAMDNVAFEDAGAGSELARILRQLADDVGGASRDELPGQYPVRDINGNCVGVLVVGG